ncbi:hypothetical protein IV102_29335 [bacterium]|nr:hypothetical protein [bacterium]
MRWLWLWILLVSVARADVVLRLGSCGRVDGYSQSLARQLQQWLQGDGLRLALAAPGGDLEQMQTLCSGDVQLTLVRSTALANYYRPWGLLSLPYLWENPSLWFRGLGGQRLLAPVEGQPFRALACWSVGQRCLASRQPLSDWKELQGRQVLVPQSRFSWDAYVSVGAQPLLAPLERSSEFSGAEMVEATRLDLDEMGLLASYPWVWQPDHGREWLVLVVQERAYRRLSVAHRQRLSGLQAYQTRLEEWLRARELRVVKKIGEHASQLPPAQRSGAEVVFQKVRQRSLRLLEPGWYP